MSFQSETVLCDDSNRHTVTTPKNHTGARILIVDDELAQRKLLAVMMEQSGIVCKAAASAEQALDLLRVEPVDGVIADLNMPGKSGMELLKEIRLRYPRIVFVMATGLEDVRLGVQAMLQGADDYLIKPLQMDSVVVSLDRAFYKKNMEQELESYRRNLEAMVCQRTVQLQKALGQVEESYAETLDALGAAIDLRDGQTAGHSRRVALYSMKILSQLQGTPKQFKTLVMGAWLHDIGKLAIPDAILLKPSALTPDEWTIMQAHVRIGYDLVKRIPFLADAAEVILGHHEHWDGSGYPRGLRGLEIPYSARVFAVADALDAITSDRPYRLAFSFQEARERIRGLAGTQFDPQIAEALLAIPEESLEGTRGESSSMRISATLAGIAVENPVNPAGSGAHGNGMNE
jgi:response regulator RpfG family c-di-GMP phosphodiesterase